VPIPYEFGREETAISTPLARPIVASFAKRVLAYLFQDKPVQSFNT